MTAAGMDPAFGWPMWHRLASAWQVSHTLFLVALGLILFLVALPVEVRVGRAQLMASWGLPCVLQSWILGRAWPEVAAFATMVTMLVFAGGRGEKLPVRIWVPLVGVMGLTLFQLQAPWQALGIALATGFVIGWKPRSEAVNVLGMASGAALLAAWLA